MCIRDSTCTWSAERTFGTRAVKRRPSPFLDLILTDQDETAPPVETVENLRYVRDIRAKLVDSIEPAEEPDPLDVRLRSWRTEVATAAKTPAFVVFSDKTLHAIVEAAPTTLEQLSEVSGIGPVKLTRYGDSILEIVSSAAGDVIDIR